MKIQKNIFGAVRVSVPGLFLAASLLGAAQQPTSPGAPHWADAEQAMKGFRLAKGLKIEVWAAEPQLQNPVAFCTDEKGRIYVAETFWHGEGAMDIRGHMDWLMDDLACRTVEDRVAMYKRKLGEAKVKAFDLTSERVQLLEDKTGSGRADSSVLFAEGFNSPAEGVAAGVLARKGNVWFTDIPSLWWLHDSTGLGKADQRKALGVGFGVHMAFMGHDMHGLRIGPDGKLYFSIGDRGLNAKTPDGRTLSNPDSGAVMRCNLDGSEMELFATGLRNPQKLAFDQYGNLWTGDNNCDQGDQARLVYICEGADHGWRIGYQSVPEAQKNSPWHVEKLWHPANKAQPAYLVPPVAHVSSGPSGFTFYPGTGLPSQYENHFLLNDYRGDPGGSKTHSFTVEPKGAGFTMKDREDFLVGMAASDVEFSVGGGVYLLDWTGGWDKTGRGRIFHVFDPALANDPLVQETKKLIGDGMEKRSLEELAKLLAHADSRVRQEAQFELAARGDKAVGVLTSVAQKNENPLARLHAIWGLGQVGQKNPKAVVPLVALLKDSNEHVRMQAAKVLGERRVTDAYAGLVALLKDDNSRVRFFAAMALGKLGRKDAVAPLLEMLAENADKDPWLRHAGAQGLAWIGDVSALTQAAKHPSLSARIGAVVALRKLARPEVAVFLNDADAAVALEAAHAIHDVPIEAALPQLAALVAKPGFHPSVLPRAVNANFRLGTAPAAAALAAFAANENSPNKLRVDAIKRLTNWAKPEWRDHVTGLWLPLQARDAEPAVKALKPQIAKLLRDSVPGVREATTQALAMLQIKEDATALLATFRNAQAAPEERIAALETLGAFNDPTFTAALSTAISAALTDTNPKVRQAGIRNLPTQPNATAHIEAILSKGNLGDQQAALAALGEIKNENASVLLAGELDQLLAKKTAPEVTLDILEAAAKHNFASIKEKLKLFEESRPKNDPLATHRECLVGGNAETGQKIFVERQDAMCLKCHSIKGQGGTVGPDVAGIGTRKTREYLLESILLPNKEIAPGFENLIVSLNNGQSYVGILKSESAADLVLNTPDEGLVKISKKEIKTRVRGQSAMPEDVTKTLSKSDLRNLVEFLASQK